jgi:predicted lipid-binding transport protein (Tim44 family)
MLTAVFTVLGMIPVAPTVFWGPMAFAIMGGLLVATILTLIFLPTLYVSWFKGTERPFRSFFDSRITNHIKCKSRTGSRPRPSNSDRKIRNKEAAFSNPKPEQSFASAVGDSPIFD